MQPFRAMVAINSALSDIAAVVSLNATIDGVPPTAKIKLISRNLERSFASEV